MSRAIWMSVAIVSVGYVSDRITGLEELDDLFQDQRHADQGDLREHEERERLGITPQLIRVSVGIENPEDITEEVLGALDSAA